MRNKIIESNCIFETIVGSHAHGLNTTLSDTDYRGIYIMPFNELVFNNLFDKTNHLPPYIDETKDRQIYELRHFMFLLSQSNPNIFEMIFSDANNIILKTPIADVLMSYKASFLSKRIKDTFGAYAMAQLKRMTRHSKHIMSPQPEKKPKLQNYIKFEKSNGLRATAKELNEVLTTCICSKVNASFFKLWQSVDVKKTNLLINDKLIYSDVTLEKIEVENLTYMGGLFVNNEQFQKDIKKWEKYWKWKNNRNEKRKKLEDKFGLDCKHAMHLIRLLDTVIDIFKKKTLIVKRPNREYYLEILNGKYNFTEIIELAESKVSIVEKLCNQSNLPDDIDKQVLKDIYKKMVRLHWNL